MHSAPFPCLASVVVLQPALQLPNALLSNRALLLPICCMPLLILSESPCSARDCWGQRLSATGSVICSCRAWMWRSHSSSAAKQKLQSAWTAECLDLFCRKRPQAVQLQVHLHESQVLVNDGCCWPDVSSPAETVGLFMQPFVCEAARALL